MARYVKRIKAEGVLGRFDIDQEFHEGVNVLFGRNGTGKTTLLHILANLLNGDYKRFAFVEFKTIQVWLDDETDILVSKDKKDNYIDVEINGRSVVENISIGETIEQETAKVEEVLAPNSYTSRTRRKYGDSESTDPILPVAYFPAFRTMMMTSI